MTAREIIEAEDPKAALSVMRPMRIYIAIQGEFFAGSHGYPHLPVFSSDAARLSQIYPNATIVECIAQPQRIVMADDPGMGQNRE